MANPFEKLLRAGEGRLRRRLQRVVNAVNDLEESYAKLTDDDLRRAAWAAFAEAGEPVRVGDLVPLAPWPQFPAPPAAPAR